MKVIIAGSRHYAPIEAYQLVQEAIAAAGLSGKITEVVSGCCRGIDYAGEFWARKNIRWSTSQCQDGGIR